MGCQWTVLSSKKHVFKLPRGWNNSKMTPHKTTKSQRYVAWGCETEHWQLALKIFAKLTRGCPSQVKEKMVKYALMSHCLKYFLNQILERGVVCKLSCHLKSLLIHVPELEILGNHSRNKTTPNEVRKVFSSGTATQGKWPELHSNCASQ